MGLSTKRSWQLTPREFQALTDVYESHLYRWGIERAHFFNANFTHPQKGQRFHPEDFVETSQSRAVKAQRELDRLALEAAQIQAKLEMDLMRQNRFDESQLPAWARMTEEEKRSRA